VSADEQGTNVLYKKEKERKKGVEGETTPTYNYRRKSRTKLGGGEVLGGVRVKRET